jgi:DNA-binding LytR/AlgR family response regulator
MEISCIIVDDEEGAHKVLENYINKLGYIKLIGKFYNAIEAFHFLQTNKVNVILLDINMPEIDGFGLLDMLTAKPNVIFTTAYSDYALKGFEYNALDYLHKPIRFERFVVAMDKALKWNNIQHTDKEIEFITFNVNGVALSVHVADIYYIESLGNYVKVHVQNNIYVVHKTMNEIETQLPRRSFLRIHKSYIINFRKIQKSTNEQIQIHNATIPIGKTYKKYFAEFLKNAGDNNQTAGKAH